MSKLMSSIKEAVRPRPTRDQIALAMASRWNISIELSRELFETLVDARREIRVETVKRWHAAGYPLRDAEQRADCEDVVVRIGKLFNAFEEMSSADGKPFGVEVKK